MSVLANRYASMQMREIWSAESKVVAERDLWIAALKAQKDLGLNVSADAIAAYEKSRSKVDLESIATCFSSSLFIMETSCQARL